MKNHDTISRSVSALAESISTIVDVNSEQAAALADTFEQAEQYLKDNVADETESTPSFSQQFSSPRAAERALRKSEDTMTREELKAERDANLKSLNAISIAKALVEDQRAYSLSEAELVDLLSNHDRRDGETAAKCFSRHFETNAEVRRAIAICKDAEEAALDVDDPSEAMAKLQSIGSTQWPDLTPAQQFEKAFCDPANAALAERAHRRPAPTTSFAFPR